MKCFNPVLCYRMDKRTCYRHWEFVKNEPWLLCYKPTYVFDCLKCGYCCHKKSLELAARCVLHASLYKQNMFLTLTHDEKREDYHNEFEYPEIQKFKKDLRQFVNTSEYCHIRTGKIKRRRYPKWLYKKIEVFNVHEYGANGKKHWHLVVFGYQFQDRLFHKMSSDGVSRLYRSDQLALLWGKGFSTIGSVDEASAMYQAQYMDKDFKNGHSITSKKRAHSKHSGLGGPYFKRHFSQILSLGYVPFGPRKLPVPRYFQKLAQKHWCHFNEPSAFHDTPDRKRKFRPFKLGEANEVISQLYEQYRNMKEERIMDLELQFEETILSYMGSKLVPEFEQSGANFIHDQKRKIIQERF